MSHLLFVDNSFFFFRADANDCIIVKLILHTYENTFGQAVNLKKSGIFFSSIVPNETEFMACGELEVSSPLNNGRYLGLPSMISRNKKQIFSFLKVIGSRLIIGKESSSLVLARRFC